MSNERIAAYAASLDPITNGHIDVIKRMAPLYDKLIVIVAVDPRKTYTFTPGERAAMASAAVANFPNVVVDICEGHYVVKHADSLGAKVLIRGLRNAQDLEAEDIITEENHNICPYVETVLVQCRPQLRHVSSSMVKGHVGVDPGWENEVARSVPPAVTAKLKQKYILDKARRHWVLLMSALGNPNDSDLAYRAILAHYTEATRAYHNLEHIVNMLDEYKLGDNSSVILAIWFHDIIYNTHASDNEEQSAVLADRIMEKMGLTEGFRKKTCDLILATRHSEIPTGRDTQIICDLDLVTLGKPEKEYDVYEAAIRKEYDWVNDADFGFARIRVLKKFLDHPYIYWTPEFRDLYEAQARENLQRAIRELKEKR